MYDRNYAITRRLKGLSFEDANRRVREELAKEGFGIITEIDVQATLKKKIGVDVKPYLILGACNPTYAHQALAFEAPLGVFLPCNVDVFVGDDDAVWLQAVNPEVVFGLVGKPEVQPIAVEIGARLRRSLEAVQDDYGA